MYFTKIPLARLHRRLSYPALLALIRQSNLNVIKLKINYPGNTCQSPTEDCFYQSLYEKGKSSVIYIV